MAINFPSNPIANETHNDAGRQWKWDGTSWRLEGNASNYTHPNHSGDVTSSGDGATTIADDVIEEKHINAGGTVGADKVLVYDSNESTNWKWADQSGSGGLQNIVEDTTPQLGGNLDVNGKIIEFGDSSTGSENRLKLGSHDDIQLYHDGTTSILKEKKGQFDIISEPNSGPGNIDITSTTLNWISGSSTVVALTSSGITITGSLTAGGLTYPTTNGNLNDVLTSDGSGGISWSTPSGASVGSLNQVLTVGNTSTLALTAGNITGDSLNLASSTLSISHAAGETFVNNANSDIKFQADKFSFDTAASGSSQIALIVDQNFIKPITIKDKDDSIGAAGEILSSTGSQVEWIAAPSGGASNLNDLGDVNAGSPGDGQVLKWQASTSKWIAAADLTATGGSGGISLTDLSHLNATPAVSAS